jgi:hypothetical protein
MVSKAEQSISRSLRAVLSELPIGATIPDSEQYRKFLTALQYFIPEVLGEIHREWMFQGLDDVVPIEARKTGEGEAEIFGVCCFVSDQTLTPLHVHLQMAVPGDEISWLECRLGEREQEGMVRKPYRFLNEMIKRVRRLDGRVDLIDWVYKVTCGNVAVDVVRTNTTSGAPASLSVTQSRSIRKAVE